MLFCSGQLRPGERVLVQGANGGLATATIALAVAAGAHVSVTSRSGEALEHARKLGAQEVVESRAPLAEPVDVVIDSVGEATWPHSVRSLRFGGRLVVAGATSGAAGEVDIRRVFRNELRIVGHKMGTLADFVALCSFLETTGTRPLIAEVYDGLDATPDAMAAMVAGDRFGKIVVRVS
jgi:NADPH:quinone reductase-like Zn-dependent oxidoreductase